MGEEETKAAEEQKEGEQAEAPEGAAEEGAATGQPAKFAPLPEGEGLCRRS